MLFLLAATGEGGGVWRYNEMRPLGEKVLYLFAFLVDPKDWNENHDGDDTEPLSSDENVSYV